MNADEGLPVATLRPVDDELESALRAAQAVVLQHPVAAQAAWAALVAEGRRHAATGEGTALRERLSRSPMALRLKQAFEIGTFHMLDADPAGVLPATFADILLLAAGTGGLEAVLERFATDRPAEGPP